MQRVHHKIGLVVIMIFAIFVLGGCQNMTESEKQAYFQEAEKKATSYFKDKYELDVVITSKELLPEMALDSIAMEGHVAEHKDQEFTISYDYNEKKIKNLGMSPAIKEAITAKGYDPYEK